MFDDEAAYVEDEMEHAPGNDAPKSSFSLDLLIKKGEEADPHGSLHANSEMPSGQPSGPENR